ncbi:MAG: flagellar hook assembly protein FlgD [Alphaproteobacteria bacterium]|nr:flagellar hook assembly protein FlgD [Alphaproteobacteria bacterium]
MAVSGVSGGMPSQSEASRNTFAKDLDTFLLLLTTQLKHQDPLNPMDSHEFTNQLVQFAQVEQSININRNLEDLLVLNKSSLGVSALGYLGRTIQVISSAFPLQDGFGKFAYFLPEEAATAVISIQDLDGNIVHTISGEVAPGRHVFDWDGKTQDGRQLPDGVYILNVTAFSAESGAMLEVVTVAFGIATGVASEGDQIAIALGDIVVPIENVLAVHTNETIAKNNPPGGGDNGATPPDDTQP